MDIQNIQKILMIKEQPMLEGMSLGEKIVFQELLQKVLLNSIKVQQEMKNNQKRL